MGPRTFPWGTPEVTGIVSELSLQGQQLKYVDY